MIVVFKKGTNYNFHPVIWETVSFKNTIKSLQRDFQTFLDTIVTRRFVHTFFFEVRISLGTEDNIEK
jgi:hypothetical protein